MYESLKRQKEIEILEKRKGFTKKTSTIGKIVFGDLLKDLKKQKTDEDLEK
jgi:hypothetical protein